MSSKAFVSAERSLRLCSIIIYITLVISTKVIARNGISKISLWDERPCSFGGK